MKNHKFERKKYSKNANHKATEPEEEKISFQTNLELKEDEGIESLQSDFSTIFQHKEQMDINNFRDVYLSELTQSFGDELDQLRKTEVDFNEKKFSVLVDYLSFGCNLFSTVERDLIQTKLNTTLVNSNEHDKIVKSL